MEKKDSLISYWLQTSDLDFAASQSLLEDGKYPHSLFFLHLSIEKLLKAFFIEKLEDYPPKTHNLLMLGKTSGIEFPLEWEETILELNSFNQEARYPDEKLEFYKKCNQAFAIEYMKKGKEIREWIKTKL